MMFLYSRTISSLFLLPAIVFAFKKKLYVDCLVGIFSMVGSILCHYVGESEQVVEVFDLDFWDWYLIDTVAASLALVTLATYITKIRGETRTLVLLFTVMTELVLDMHFSANFDNFWMTMENIVLSGICILVVILRRRHIRSSRLQCICISFLYVLSAAIVDVFHSLFHVGVFGTTFLVYYFEEATKFDDDQDADETSIMEESITSTASNNKKKKNTDEENDPKDQVSNEITVPFTEDDGCDGVCDNKNNKNFPLRFSKRMSWTGTVVTQSSSSFFSSSSLFIDIP